MHWNIEEEVYLHCIQTSCEQLSNLYLEKFRRWRRIQAKIKIPIIVVGSFTGITSFGSETFPKYAQKWVSVGVGIVTIGIAVLNTIESYFKIGESANAAINTSNAFQQLREDINRELSIPPEGRSANGLTVLRDSYTRYHQILNQAPVLDEGDVFYIPAVVSPRLEKIMKNTMMKYQEPDEDTTSTKTQESKISRFFKSKRFTSEDIRETPALTIERSISPSMMERNNSLDCIVEKDEERHMGMNMGIREHLKIEKSEDEPSLKQTSASESPKQHESRATTST